MFSSEASMNSKKDCCFKLNKEFRDIRLSTDQNLQKIKDVIISIEKYQTQHPESDLSELKLAESLENLRLFVSKFHEYNPNLKYIFIQSPHGHWISSQDGRRPIYCSFGKFDRDVPLAWEVFEIHEIVENGKSALKSCKKYVSSENGENSMKCDRQEIGEWEKFDLIEHGSDIYSFKGNNGKYVSCELGKEYITCTAEEIGDNEKFYFCYLKNHEAVININWTQFELYFTKLTNEYNDAMDFKAKINPEKYYIKNEIEVYHDGGGGRGRGNHYFTHHEQKIFNQKAFKTKMHEADEKVYDAKSRLDRAVNELHTFLWGEKRNQEKVSKMIKKLVPTIAILDGKPIPEEEIEKADNGIMDEVVSTDNSEDDEDMESDEDEAE